MAAPVVVERDSIPHNPENGTDLVYEPNSPDGQIRLWIKGGQFPRIVIDVPGHQVLVGDGTFPPVDIAGAAGDPSSFIREDVVANRGSFGNPGHLFGATDTQIGYRDSGTAWLPFFPVLDGTTGRVTATVLPKQTLLAGRVTMAGARVGLATDAVVGGGNLTGLGAVSYTLPTLDPATTQVPNGWPILIQDDTDTATAGNGIVISAATGDTIQNPNFFSGLGLFTAGSTIRVLADVPNRRWRWDGILTATASPSVSSSDSAKLPWTTSGVNTAFNPTKLMATDVNGTSQTVSFTAQPYTGYTVNTGGANVVATLPNAPLLNTTVFIRHAATASSHTCTIRCDNATNGGVGTDLFNIAGTVTDLVLPYPGMTCLCWYRSGVWFTLVGWEPAALDLRYQPLATLLNDIVGLTFATDDTIQYKAGHLANRTMAQLRTDLGLLGAQQYVDLAADQTVVNNSTTLTNVTALVVALVANATYRFDGVIFYRCAAAADLKFGWTGPTGVTMKWHAQGVASSAAADSQINAVLTRFINGLTTGNASGGTGVTVNTDDNAMPIRGIVRTDATHAGNLQFQAAQLTADVSDLVVLNGSHLFFQRVA